MLNQTYLELRLSGDIDILNKDEKNFFLLLQDNIRKADAVFSYRVYMHDDNKSATEIWIEDIADIAYEVIDIDISAYGKTETITAQNNEKIFQLNLTSQRVSEFIKNFKLSIKPIENLHMEYNNSEIILVNDSIFEEYNYIFTYDNEVVAMLDSHTLDVLVKK